MQSLKAIVRQASSRPIPIADLTKAPQTSGEEMVEFMVGEYIHRAIGRTLSRDMDSQSAWTPLIGFRPFELQLTNIFQNRNGPWKVTAPRKLTEVGLFAQRPCTRVTIDADRVRVAAGFEFRCHR